MSSRFTVFVIVVVLACLSGFYLLGKQEQQFPSIAPDGGLLSFGPDLPDFSEFERVDEKKKAFFEFLLPLIEAENQRIGVLREALLHIASQQKKLTDRQKHWLLELAVYYRVIANDASTDHIDMSWLIDELVLRVDQVPPSLALAQAANESAWGTSRFAIEGNNLYGQWCFKEGCGLVPSSRPEGANYEVASFSTPAHSVQRYIYNLNTHLAYQHFRDKRATQRQTNEPLSGRHVVDTLARYSTRGSEYIQELKAMMRVNKLYELDDL